MNERIALPGRVRETFQTTADCERCVYILYVLRERWGKRERESERETVRETFQTKQNVCGTCVVVGILAGLTLANGQSVNKARIKSLLEAISMGKPWLVVECSPSESDLHGAHGLKCSTRFPLELAPARFRIEL